MSSGRNQMSVGHLVMTDYVRVRHERVSDKAAIIG